MRFITVCSTLLLVAAASAQGFNFTFNFSNISFAGMTEEKLLTHLPECTRECQYKASLTTGCDLDDFYCQCHDHTWDIARASGRCFYQTAANCTDEEGLAFFEVIIPLCGYFNRTGPASATSTNATISNMTGTPSASASPVMFTGAAAASYSFSTGAIGLAGAVAAGLLL